MHQNKLNQVLEAHAKIKITMSQKMTKLQNKSAKQMCLALSENNGSSLCQKHKVNSLTSDKLVVKTLVRELQKQVKTF